ncbi:GIY-YIG nuclease family protein [Namhaeicola litoreus]|uniref:GIY-YIG nuclease family protein n=1 Tax=Namhaeicola litoreus TaxID=1052145 RepID=A0ABW3XZ96_9FLAO
MMQLNLADTKELECRPGVYRIYWIKNGKRQPIKRFMGSDKTGLIYIGESINIRKRLNEFRNAAFGKSQESHVGGKKIFRLDILKSHIQKKDLFFEFEYTEPNEHRDRENQLLEHYKQKFGEVPPLNG